MAVVVPGHRPVMRDWGYARQVRRLLEAATSRTAAMARQGRTLVRIEGNLGLDDLRRAKPVWTGAALDADWKESIQVLIERAWRGVRGQG